MLNEGPANHIRDAAYKYVRRLDKDLAMIERLKKIQADMLNLLGVAITAALISVGNFIARMGYDFYSKGGSQSDMFAIIIVVSAVFGFFLCISLLMWCWRRRHAKLKAATGKRE